MIKKIKSIFVGKELHKKMLNSDTGGNISYTTDNGNIIITKTNTSLDKLTLCSFVKTNIYTNEAPIASSKETKLHKCIYKKINGAKSIIHVHPVYSIAISDNEVLNLVQKKGLFVTVISQQEAGSASLIKIVNKELSNKKNTNLIILKNHGIIAVGKSIYKCMLIIELYEHCCKVSYLRKVYEKSCSS